MAGLQASKDSLLNNDRQLVEVANFAITKALAKLNVFEEEAKILEHELRAVENEIKIKKVTNFISKQSS